MLDKTKMNYVQSTAMFIKIVDSIYTNYIDTS